MFLGIIPSQEDVHAHQKVVLSHFINQSRDVLFHIQDSKITFSASEKRTQEQLSSSHRLGRREVPDTSRH